MNIVDTIYLICFAPAIAWGIWSFLTGKIELSSTIDGALRDLESMRRDFADRERSP